MRGEGMRKMGSGENGDESWSGGFFQSDVQVSSKSRSYQIPLSFLERLIVELLLLITIAGRNHISPGSCNPSYFHGTSNSGPPISIAVQHEPGKLPSPLASYTPSN